MFETNRKIKDLFSSRLGFILSSAGSAIGLGNIWKFPYIVGKFGGGTFLIVYIIFLLLAGFPAFLSELFIGKATNKRPQDAFLTLGKTKWWGYSGLVTIWTGFFVSAFYCVVAGWILGYFFEAIIGNLRTLETVSEANTYFQSKMASPLWGLSFHFLFATTSYYFLIGGVQKGIEKMNKIVIPLFFLILFGITAWALFLPTASSVFEFMTQASFTNLPNGLLLVALGHAFFTLSIGQGTLVTYGSYAPSKKGFFQSAVIICIADTMVSFLAAFSILSIIFYAKEELTYGPSLIFATLPAIFSELPASYLLSTAFFFFIFIAALTSQVSALEPMISHIQAHKNISRKGAVTWVCISSFIIGLPCTFSSNLLSGVTFFGQSPLDFMNFATTSVLVPLGGLAAVLLVSCRWKVTSFLNKLAEDAKPHSALKAYLTLTLTFVTPVLIFMVFLHDLGWI